MSRGAVMHIDLAALRHNLKRTRQLSAGARILAMIKSNGYGHGALRVARALNGADAFGVASVQEACELRQAGVASPIVVMSGFYDTKELNLLSKWRLQPVIHHPFQLDILEKHSLPQPLPAWIKFNTGMNRLGFRLNQFHHIMARVQQSQGLAKSPVLMTHLAEAYKEPSPFTHHQMNTFLQKATAWPDAARSIANSAAILRQPRTVCEWVRPGLMLYGASALPDKLARDFGLKPVMTLKARIMALQDCLAGEAIGYDCAYHCPENMRIAIVAIGYGDGYPRHAQNGTPTLVNNIVCPVVGRVSMDMIAIDCRGYPQARIGEEVTLWGDGLPVEQVAVQCDTIPYELFCQVSERVERRYHGA